MAIAAKSLPNGDFSIARIFALAIETIRHNPLQMFFLALLFGAAPVLLTSYGLDSLQDAQGNELSLQTWAVFGFTMVVSAAVSPLPQAFLTRLVIAESEGHQMAVMESLRTGLVTTVPILAMGFAYGVAVVAGLALLIVPGFMLMAAWAVTAPVLIEERRGIVGSFRRSQDLTRGVRWKITGLLLVFYAVYVGKEVGVHFISGEWENSSLAASYKNPVHVGLTAITETLLVALWASVLAALYVELRDWKDGPATSRLEQIFA